MRYLYSTAEDLGVKEFLILMGSRMFDVAKAMVLASLPDGLTDLEVKARLCERLYGDEIDVSAFLQHLKAVQRDS